MTPEQHETSYQAAIQDLCSCIDPEIGFKASGKKEKGPNNRFDGVYTRDFSETLEETVRYADTALLRLVIPPAQRTVDLIVSKIGEKVDLETGERPGKPPHEILTTKSNQEWLSRLTGNFPVRTVSDGPEAGLLYMDNYFADDAPSELRNAICNVANGLLRLSGIDKARAYGKTKWPVVVETLEYDLRQGDIDGDGLLESDPPPEQILKNPTFKDSGRAFVDEDGQMPEGPRKYLRNNIVFADSLRKCAELASNIGYQTDADNLMRRYQELRRKIQEVFWRGEDRYFAPAVYSTGKRAVFVGEDAVEGLWRGLYSREVAFAVLQRLAQPDINTPWGPRTRSINSAQFKENGPDSYHNGLVWPQEGDKAAEGAMQYGFRDFALLFLGESLAYRQVQGNSECGSVPVDNSGLFDYEEDGIPVAGKPHAWSAGGSIMVLRQLAQIHNTSIPQLQLVA